jgi:integrase/recombinase XerD
MTTPALALLEAGGDLERGRLTLTQAAKSYLRWLESRNLSANTLMSYGHGLSAFLTFAAGAKLQNPGAVTVLACEAYFLWLRERGLSAQTVSHRRSVLVSLWRWLEHEGFADRNVPGKTFPVKTSRRAAVYPEPHEVDDFLAKLATLTTPIGRRDYALTAMLFYSGMRVGELAALRVSSVDMVARRIKVLHGKGDKDRTIVLPPRLAPILGDYIREIRPALLTRPAGTVHFHTKRGRWLARFTRDGRLITRAFTTEAEARQALASLSAPHLSTPLLFVPECLGRRPARRAGLGLLERSIYKIIRDRAREMLGVRLSPHNLRHACASYLIYHGAQPETVQKHLGHANLSTTLSIYVHVPQKRQHDEIGRVFG